ncbi:MAG: efflux RND transporter periplasmic adaptor subunit [Chloroflexi bacterium]|nr:efflux RND transporter periplasmic adaptor subunit [Chloroflexota bacterium]
MKKWWFLGLAVVLIGAAIYYFGPLRVQQQNALLANLQTEAAAHGSLTATVGATGLVRANQTAQLAWRTTGTVERVLVAVGEAVEKDQPLATLEQTTLPQNVILAQADLVSAQRALDDLLNSQFQQAQALQNVEKAQQALDDALNPELAQAQALEAIAAAQKAVEDAERVYRWSLQPSSGSSIDEAEAQVTLAKDRLDQAQERYAPYADKPEDNLTRARLQIELANAQQQYDAAVRNYNGLTGTSGATDQAVAQANLETARAQQLEAQREWERIKDGASPADVALLEAQLADAQREWERLKEGADPDDLAAAQARVAAAQATLAQASITAPFAGVVTQAESRPGDQAAPGALAFRLDDLTRLLVDVQVSEVDINRIQTGQAVTLVFDAIPNQEYHGVVSEVAPVGAATQGVVDFTVTVELTDADDAVRPGMTAAVNIVVNELNDVLLAPNRAVRVEEGVRVVYVLRSGVLEPVEITLGASSETHSEVIAGELKEGDAIVLNPPAAFEQDGPPPFMRR